MFHALYTYISEFITSIKITIVTLFTYRVENRMVHNEVIQSNITVSRRNNQSCGYCKTRGHTVNHCNDEKVIQTVTQINTFINRTTVTDVEISEWIVVKDTMLLKAVLSKLKMYKFRNHLTRDEICEKIERYIRIQQMLQFLRFLDDVTTMRNDIRVENLTMDEIYMSFSIEIKQSSDISEEIECPICLDTVNEQIHKTNCSHEFCKKCLCQTLITNFAKTSFVNCPMCRTRVSEIFV
jgi:hypothetical protein